jgi:hypothetical protein
MTTRRNFLKGMAASTLIPLVSVTTPSQAATKVPMDDPTAKALKYVEDATTATRADKMGVAGSDQLCSNCRFYAAETEPGWAPCALFQNRLVAGPGWCAGWVPTA